ncbi:MAG: transcriptional regulator [Candidatus Bathyarchaeota archaeon]|nr:transcriptional regulator [Candidatus Termiticorpusculum sp.]
MVSKDQAIGGAILVVCILIAVIYSVVIFKPDWVITYLNLSTWDYYIRLYAVVVPVYVAFIAIMFIGAWIGWTMATTPPPKPIEEITTEIEDKKVVAPEANTK